ncbi:hypothetical protein [Hydrogenophaga sp. T2]|uniref:hypothetical protein n=1 Tax=Hydrogenophaga sp. T2 TaxID=3132823 RepID=UPI003CF3EEBE
MHLNSTAFRGTTPITTPPDSGEPRGPGAALPVTGGQPLQRAGTHDGRARRKADRLRERERRKAGPHPGDPLGNGVAAVLHAGDQLARAAADWAARAMHGLLPPDGEWPGNPLGPLGTAAEPLDVEASGAVGAQCRPGQQCRTLDTLQAEFGASFELTFSPSLRRRADRSLSGVIVVLADHDHYHVPQQALLTDTLAAMFEAGDRLFVETRADAPPAPVYCRGVPAEACAGIDDPAEAARLLALGQASTAAARAAQHFIAQQAPQEVPPVRSNDYGQVREAFLRAYARVRSGEIPIADSKVRQLIQKVEALNTADALFQRESHAPDSHARRNRHMAEQLASAARALQGHKGFAVVGLGHLKSGLQAELMQRLDCVSLHQRVFQADQLGSSTW